MVRHELPLYVDMDGTLIRTDTLKEAALSLLRRSPWFLLLLMAWLCRGRVALKREIASRVVPAPDGLPMHQAFLAFLRDEHARGRTLVLATASDERVASAVAAHVGLFSQVLATRSVNLSGPQKLQAIRAHARGPFAYAGNSRDDLPIWQASAEALAVCPSAGVRRRLQRLHPQARIFERQTAVAWALLKAMRPSQWSKNLLVFLPLVTAHVRNPDQWWHAAAAFVAFGLCASASYLLNDLFDLEADRAHLLKRHRPLASGELGLGLGASFALLSGAAGLLIAASLSPSLLAMLAGYVVLTLAYSSRLKTMPVVDVLVLAVLYAWRVLAGALVVAVPLSNWLLGFAWFLFLSLALVKRCAELQRASIGAKALLPGRGYGVEDLPILRAMGVASGFAAVLVLTLYIDSQNGKALYPSPGWLWGLIPLQLGWTMRIWLTVARGNLSGEDPVSFVLGDGYSWLTLAAMGACAFAAAGAG